MVEKKDSLFIQNNFADYDGNQQNLALSRISTLE
jgi:hypothetical protein